MKSIKCLFVLPKGWLSVLLLLSCSVALAGELPSIFSDHLILQREESVPVWGWEEPGTEVEIDFRDRTAVAVAGPDGRWQAAVPTGAAGGPFEMTIRGSTTATLRDILVGEVWVAGGQSNMWWALGKTENAEEEIRLAAALPKVRVFDTNTGPREAGWPKETPQRSVPAEWVVPNRDNAGELPSTAYYFARELHKELGVPVGIVHVAVPGTPVESHMSPKTIADLGLVPYTVGEGERKRTIVPGVLYNGGVAPVVPFAARGFIWWQGEANQDNPEQYRTRFPALVQGWREAWNAPKMPFLYVELHGFGPHGNSPVEEATFPRVRDAQRSALALDHVYRIAVPDILQEPGWQIHPPRKQIAGRRLAEVALADVYCRNGARPPEVATVSFDGHSALLTYKHAKALRLTAGPHTGFALSGDDGQWHHADAEVRGNQVTLRCAEVPRPVAVRFGFVNHPAAHLYNEAGLPAGQYRSDTRPLGKE